ncbi:MAG: hypothetical protein ACRD27_10765 [Terracidiphilus sp.]
MTDAIVTIDEKSQSRQFWLRTLLVVGMLWGFLPFVMSPFITKGPHDSYFDIFASILNSLTVLPACTLAFWHRRTACIWLTINGVILAIALATFIERLGKPGTEMILEVAGPIVIALLLDVMEARRWPAARNTRNANARQPWG